MTFNINYKKYAVYFLFTIIQQDIEIFLRQYFTIL